jgi:hypothetical protein
LFTNNRIVSIVDDDIYITKLFDIALRENIDGISVFSFTDPDGNALIDSKEFRVFI